MDCQKGFILDRPRSLDGPSGPSRSLEYRKYLVVYWIRVTRASSPRGDLTERFVLKDTACIEYRGWQPASGGNATLSGKSSLPSRSNSPTS